MSTTLPSSRQFTRFPELSPELRLKIWGFAAVCYVRDDYDRDRYCRYYKSTMFWTNREAREVALADLGKLFLSIKDQLPTSVQSFQFIAKSPVFDIRACVNATGGGNHSLILKYAGKELEVGLGLYSIKVGGGEKLVKEWSGFLKSSLESCVNCVTGSDDPEKLGETLRKDALALNKYATYSCSGRKLKLKAQEQNNKIPRSEQPLLPGKVQKQSSGAGNTGTRRSLRIAKYQETGR